VIERIGVVGAGDMGSGVARALARSGFTVLTDLSGRSAATHQLAREAGMRDLGSLEQLARESDLLLSIVPPAAAREFAARALAAITATGADTLFADCNAVSPATLASIAASFISARARFVDVGIVGRPPGVGRDIATRFYVSGAERGALGGLAVDGVQMIDMGEALGRASAIKMAYAGLNKGLDALLAAVLLASERLGVRPELMEELGRSQAPVLARMKRRVPYLAATAERFVPEMREIAATFEAAGVTPCFHEGAASIYDTLAETPLARETRATLPAHRSLGEALAVFAAALEKSAGR
jgi:3-hydroxyisobutyrate dehydrogenase-like beta-hydroxyacid dehydrogenase